MFDNKIGFGKKIEAEAVFEMLKNSEHMRQKGYGILYATPYYGKKSHTQVKGGITLEKYSDDKNVLLAYGLCYAHEDELIYIHIRLAPGKINEFTYMIACGDREQAETNLVELAKEIKNASVPTE